MQYIKSIVRRIRLGKSYHVIGLPGSGWECCDGYYGQPPICGWRKGK